MEEYMRKFFGALAVVSVLAISMPANAVPQRDNSGIGVVQQILAKLRNGIVRVLDTIGWPKRKHWCNRGECAKTRDSSLRSFTLSVWPVV
jgi:hypothetical protein